METSPESPAPSTEELGELEAEFARLEAELGELDELDEVDPAVSGDLAQGGDA